MKAFKALLTIWTVVYLMAEILVPYPRPDYKDQDLISKEIVNGTLPYALRDEIAHSKAPGERYAMSADNFIASSVESGKIAPQFLSFDIQDYGIGGLKEMAWLPLYLEAGMCSPKEIYNPKRYYNHFEIFKNKKIATNVSYDEHIGASVPYYDENNPGLWGGKTVKDSDGNIVGCKRGFFSLKRGRFDFLVDVPKAICDGTYWINMKPYLRGAYLMVDIKGNNAYHLMTLDMQGNFHDDSTVYKAFVSLGDFGLVAAVNDDGNTVILDNTLKKVDEFDGDFVSYIGVTMASGVARYPFGTKIGNKLYFARDDGTSWSWAMYRNDDETISAKPRLIKKPVWKYQVKTKYDYATNMYAFDDGRIKTMKYNFIIRGCQPKLHLPPHTDDDRVRFDGWDGYGDFAVVKDKNGNGTLYHTYDFKKWEKVGKEPTSMFASTSRIWINGGGIDGLVGITPFNTIALRPVVDQNGNKYMAVEFDGIGFYYR